ncbi:uncharacterized protein CG13380 isoform X2 [Phymastichus coffea]|uniref:uncharacterized protein CG13380 isoform X2 n=1 Tax=Phymastichus coffea TaxID=108790 RepID=UPI00273A9AFB|nr:uncharacterized protein CG13380 isoform X2 [Phymastichus coffea]
MVRDSAMNLNKQVNQNLAKPIEGIIRGRGFGKFDKIGSDCICNRPYSHIICLNCGYLMFGRVRYGCPKHKMVTFLIDITNCPKCKAFEYMLEEFTIQDSEHNSIQENNLDNEEEDEDL